MNLAIVKTDVPMTAGLCSETIDALAAAYPFCRSQVLTETAKSVESGVPMYYAEQLR